MIQALGRIYLCSLQLFWTVTAWTAAVDAACFEHRPGNADVSHRAAMRVGNGSL